MSPSDGGTDTEARRLYRKLKHEILTVFLRPGQPLAEVELARRLGASRTPLREALLRLEADGLVRIEPRRGAFVQELTVSDFLEINELRSVLESYAARLAARRIEPRCVHDLQSHLILIRRRDPEEGDYRRLAELDDLVHAAIAEASGNTRMGRIIRGLDDMMEVMREGDMRSRHQEMYDSLSQILDALACRDGKRAEVLLGAHIADFQSAIVRSR